MTFASNHPRYAGKPFLLVLDFFVLKCIGFLEPRQEAAMVQMTPKLNETYGLAGSWEDVVVAQLHFPSDIRSQIRLLWDRNQAIAKQHGVPLEPMAFVEMFVAKNVTNDAQPAYMALSPQAPSDC